MLDIKSQLPGLGVGRALDVGARLGEFSIKLAGAMPAGSEVIGLDSDEQTVAQANEQFHGSGIVFRVGDGANIGEPDGSFDVVAISNTLHHICCWEAVPDEMYRVLKPGGCFVVNEMFCDGQNPAQQTHFAQHTLEARIDCLTGGYQRATWTKGELLEMLSRLPLDEVRVTEYLEDPEQDKKLEVKNAGLLQAAEKLAGRPEYEEIRSEAVRVQQLFRDRGIQRCTQLFYAGRKPK